MAKITRIKAKDPGKSPEEPLEAPKTVKKVKVGNNGSLAKNQPKKAAKAQKADTAKKLAKSEKSENKSKEKKPFILIRPLVYLGRYIKNSWAEIRLVRWPTRKATWKLVLAIFIYTGLFIAIIMLLDAFFTWLFSIVIG